MQKGLDFTRFFVNPEYATPYAQLDDNHGVYFDTTHGEPSLKMRPFTDEEWDTLPHVPINVSFDWSTIDPESLPDVDGMPRSSPAIGYLQEVDYDLDEVGASLTPQWGRALFLENGENVGNTVPYRLLVKDTRQVILRRYVRIVRHDDGETHQDRE